jgi:hypothetical protein
MSDCGADDASGAPRHLSATIKVQNQQEAREALRQDPKVAALVMRDSPRAVVFRCPCPCGETLVINLDPRAGRAWRFRNDQHGLTLMPSVWRTTGCRSHFIVWRSGIWWCGYDEESESEDYTARPREGDAWPQAMEAELSEEWDSIRRRERERPREGRRKGGSQNLGEG